MFASTRADIAIGEDDDNVLDDKAYPEIRRYLERKYKNDEENVIDCIIEKMREDKFFKNMDEYEFLNPDSTKKGIEKERKKIIKKIRKTCHLHFFETPLGIAIIVVVSIFLLLIIAVCLWYYWVTHI